MLALFVFLLGVTPLIVYLCIPTHTNPFGVKHFGYVCVLSNNTLGKDFYTIEYSFEKIENSTNVVAYLETDTPRLHQRELHKRLSRYRLNKKTNVFSCDLRTITKELSRM